MERGKGRRRGIRRNSVEVWAGLWNGECGLLKTGFLKVLMRLFQLLYFYFHPFDP